MKLKHKQPCAECPWRKDSTAGWLGGHSPELYADAVAANEVPACHLKDFGPNSPRTAMCAGSLAVAANNCIVPHRTEGGPEARAKIGVRADCFTRVRDFYQHHAGRAYVPRYMRGR